MFIVIGNCPFVIYTRDQYIQAKKTPRQFNANSNNKEIPQQGCTLGFPNQFIGLNVAKRLRRSPLSHGRHDGLDDPRADPPALVLSEVHGAWDPTKD